MNSIVLWEYAEDTPIDKLLRHHRAARTVVYIWIASSVLMCSTAVDCLFSEGWWMEVMVIVVVVATAVALLSAIPGILCLAWVNDG